MGLFGGGNSKSTSENNQRQTTASEGSSIVDFSGDISGAGASVSITDGGAIAGNVEVANNALLTAQTITQDVSDTIASQSNRSLGAVEKLAGTFGAALESVKKTEITGGGSLFFDALRYWPVIPLAFVIVSLIKKNGVKNG